MADVGIGRLIAIERLRRAPSGGPEIHSRRLGDDRGEGVRSIPDIRDEDHEQKSNRPSRWGRCPWGTGILPVIIAGCACHFLTGNQATGLSGKPIEPDRVEHFPWRTIK